MRHTFRSPLILVSTLAVFLSATSGVQAQNYFGRNKVQYKDFKFEVMKTDHFDIYFYQEEADSAARVARMAERWYTRHSQLFGQKMKTRQPLVLYASHPDFEQTNVVGGAKKAQAASPKASSAAWCCRWRLAGHRPRGQRHNHEYWPGQHAAYADGQRGFHERLSALRCNQPGVGATRALRGGAYVRLAAIHHGPR